MKRIKFSFKKLFGSKQSNSLPGASHGSKATHKNTLDRLRDLEELLQKKQNHLEDSIANQVKEARKHGTKNKRGDLLDELCIMPLIKAC